MINRRSIEVAVGLFIAAGLAALFMLAMKVSNISAFTEGNGYQLSARFENIGGLKVRSPVTMGGVRIGRVAAIEFDQNAYQAVVTLKISPQYDRIPKDSSASIYTSGLLGEQYVGLEPGADDAYMRDQDSISLTQSALVMERLISKFLFNQTVKENGGS
ncbi:MAG: putative ABC transport system substrate-binding protein [Gammaproteobacteria bacterium]|nr:MAG: putative ABC transport system substrate-binding protein [Gammaproteobacteria bacterium]TND06281.1 MAG: putative ABC transport system substrate-binding protein [Gammaproteobacteria bacterium]